MSSSDKRLASRIAIITGASSGIGAACALALAREGCSVAINFRAGEEADALNVRDAALREGVHANAIEADISDEASVERLFARVRAELGSPDILINSAGKNGQGVHVADMTFTQWETTLRTNAGGAFLCLRAFVRERRARGGPAAIVNISSIHEDVVVPGFADYDASKAALLALTRTLAYEAGPLGITVNSIAPGMILTAMNAQAASDPAVREEKSSHIPLKRPGKPEEIAAMAVYLCTSDGAYITGASLRIDGGLSLQTGQGA